MQSKQKRTKAELTTTKLKSVVEWLLASWTLPGSVPVPRLSLANQDKGKTAVQQFHRPLRLNWTTPNPKGPTYELVPAGEMLVVLDPKIGHIIRFMNRNGTGLAVAYEGIQASTAASLILNWVGDFLDFDFFQPYSATQFAAYGNYALADRAPTGEAMFYMDATPASGLAGDSTISVSWTIPASAEDVAQGATVALMQWQDGRWVVVALYFVLLVGTGATTFYPMESGKYGIAFRDFTEETKSGGAYVAFSTITAVMETYPIQQLDLHSGFIDEYRINGNSVRVTDIVAPLSAEGAVVGCEIFGSDSWLDYLQAVENGTESSIYDSIADVEGAEEPHALIRGKYGYNKIRDRNFRKCFDNNYDPGIAGYTTVQAGDKVDDEYTYCIAAFTQATDSAGDAPGADALLTVNTDLEYITRDLWTNTERAQIDPVTVMQTQFKFNAFPTGADNPSHWNTFLKIISGAAAASAPLAAFIPIVGPGVAAGLGLASFAAGTAANFVK